MQLSSRERFLIGVLFTIIIWAVALEVFIWPGRAEYRKSVELMESGNQEREEMEFYLSHYEELEQKLKEESQVAFSKHAVERVMERSVDISSDKLERLNEGVKLAGEKGLKAPLILMDSTAFVVNVKNNRVVTVVNEESLKGTVFTNIDGTVMV